MVEKSYAQKEKKKKEEGKGRENARFKADGNYFEKFDPSSLTHPPLTFWSHQLGLPVRWGVGGTHIMR